MSSYLTIYGVPKNEGKPIDIVSFSRSHCIYSAICDEVNVAWAGESEVYTNLNTSDLDGVIHSIEEDIKSYAGKATLGQDAYYCIICTKPDKDFKYKIFGNAYEGSISKEKL